MNKDHKWKTVATWPIGILDFDGNVSIDTHKTKAEAEGVSLALMNNGNDLGVPLKVEIESIKKQGGQPGNINGLKANTSNNHLHIRIPDDMKLRWIEQAEIKGVDLTEFVKDSVEYAIHTKVMMQGISFSGESREELSKLMEGEI